ncbi:glycosyltransferase [Cytophaga aurantiaca]|uniref:glycosyltransferase n=1 Tax=Cytophaga aurantiaca TaxID=29530 RepID=UPI000379B394|nr:glycosyltransferase [Cytophaga aurantiaca]
MQNKHILYITYDGLTDFLGQSQVLPYILGLEEKGYRFSILSFEKPEKFNSNKSIIEGVISGKNITWYPKKYHKRFSILATLWDLIAGLFFLFRLRNKDVFQAVHCRSYIPAILGLLSKKIFHTKFIFDMRGFWADERIDGGLWNLKNPVFKTAYTFFKWIEKKCILNADYVVTLTQNSFEEMKQWDYVSSKVKFKIIPCCADLKVFSSENSLHEEIELLRQKLSLERKTVVSYLGSIGTWYMIDEMFDYFKRFKQNFPDAVFLFITPEKEADILEIARKHQLTKEDIRVVKAQRVEVPSYLLLSNLSLFFIKPAYSKKSSSPTKLAEIMAMGIPVVCNNNVGDVEQQVLEAKAGIVINAFSDASYDRSIYLFKNDFENVFQKSISLKYVNDHFSLLNGVNLYSEIYSEVIA